MQQRANIAKVIDFKLDRNRKVKSVDFQPIRNKNNLFLIQIQSLTVRQYVPDSIASALSFQHNVNEYVASINSLTIDGVQLLYRKAVTWSMEIVSGMDSRKLQALLICEKIGNIVASLSAAVEREKNCEGKQ
jgi:hypothetical protein